MKRVKWLIIAGAVGLAALILLIGRVDHSFSANPVAVELVRAHSVGNALGAYAQDNDNKFPRTLDELPVEFFRAWEKQFHDPVTKQVSNWIYYPGYKRIGALFNDAPPGIIVLASPCMVQAHSRIVVYADTTAEIIEEDNFARQISKQLNERVH